MRAKNNLHFDIHDTVFFFIPRHVIRINLFLFDELEGDGAESTEGWICSDK